MVVQIINYIEPIHWISVKERLPEESGFYLTWLINGNCNDHGEVQRWKRDQWSIGVVTHWAFITKPK